MIGQWLSNWILHLFGWKVTGYPEPKPRKVVIAVVPHTSNWDFPLGVLVNSAIPARGNYVGKHTLFVCPLGAFSRWLGGIPVDRTKKGGNFLAPDNN